MHDFEIDERFDVIFSIYDSINFLENFTQWKKTFRQAAKHLRKDGLFFFDMYTSEMLAASKHEKATISAFPKGYFSERAIIKRNTLTWDFKIFEKKKGSYALHTYLMKETIMPPEKVRRELRKTFTILEETRFDQGKRIFFVCKLNE